MSDLLHVVRHFGGVENLKGKKIAMWGLAFKPRTDDIREAPSLVLIERLLDAGAEIHAHDPVAAENVRQSLGDRVVCHEHHYDSLDEADVLVIVTEWNEFRALDLERIADNMATARMADLRNIYSAERAKAAGFETASC